MKGMVFTEFLGMVADRFSENMVDDIIEDSDLPSGGAYTSVGLYDHSEIVKLVESLSHRTGAPAPDLVKAFGHHLFGRLSTMHPEFVCGIDDALDFLESVDKVIHVDQSPIGRTPRSNPATYTGVFDHVRKLFASTPEAKLPRFETSREGNRLQMIYRSPRGMEDLAQGLIEGCMEHFSQVVRMERHKRPDGSTEFNLERLQ